MRSRREALDQRTGCCRRDGREPRHGDTRGRPCHEPGAAVGVVGAIGDAIRAGEAAVHQLTPAQAKACSISEWTSAVLGSWPNSLLLDRTAEIWTQSSTSKHTADADAVADGRPPGLHLPVRPSDLAHPLPGAAVPIAERDILASRGADHERHTGP